MNRDLTSSTAGTSARAGTDVVVVSNRCRRPARHWSEALALAAVRGLVAAGTRVRWFVATSADTPPPAAPSGVELVAVRGALPPFRRVQAQVEDPALEIALGASLRQRPADVVLHIGFGSPGSVSTLWLAERMGAVGLATVAAREVLCHRQTLIDEHGHDCRTLLDPDRCVECCCTTTREGLSPIQAGCARLLQRLGGWSPLPSTPRFQNRFDLVIGSLQLARVVWVATAAEQELLATAGINRRAVQVADLPALHEHELAATVAGFAAE
jgi:hypothetical protein